MGDESEDRQEADPQYLVERILLHVDLPIDFDESLSLRQYFVKWKGYSIDSSTWEGREGLGNVLHLVQKYDVGHPKSPINEFLRLFRLKGDDHGSQDDTAGGGEDGEGGGGGRGTWCRMSKARRTPQSQSRIQDSLFRVLKQQYDLGDRHLNSILGVSLIPTSGGATGRFQVIDAIQSIDVDETPDDPSFLSPDRPQGFFAEVSFIGIDGWTWEPIEWIASNHMAFWKANVSQRFERFRRSLEMSNPKLRVGAKRKRKKKKQQRHVMPRKLTGRKRRREALATSQRSKPRIPFEPLRKRRRLSRISSSTSTSSSSSSSTSSCSSSSSSSSTASCSSSSSSSSTSSCSSSSSSSSSDDDDELRLRRSSTRKARTHRKRRLR